MTKNSERSIYCLSQEYFCFSWKIGGFSTKAIKTRIFRYIFEQWQERRIPIVHKPKLSGSSAREIGTYPSEYDMQIECPVKIDESGSENDSILFHMCSDNGSWIIIKFIKVTEDVARITFKLYDEVGHFLLIYYVSKICQ